MPFFRLVDQWKQRRNQGIQNKYFRMLKKQRGKDDANKTPLGSKKTTENNSRSKSFKETKLDFERRKKKAEKMEKAAERKRQFEERKQALIDYKKRKLEKIKILSKKTKKGQPNMGARMEMLLHKIKESS